jgi:type IV pilus assembly protein PilX
VCSNALTSYTTLPWQISNKPVGVYYTPNTPTAMTFQAANPVPGSYYQTPIFYITYLGLSPNGLGAIYQVDGAGYGGTASAAAVVESTYMVQAAVKDLGVQ